MTAAPAGLPALNEGPARAGAYPAGASPCGALGMIGDVWDWTASAFGPYPGFRAFPYRQYSETHFGHGHRVLRGGSWATRPHTIETTFRSWDLARRRLAATRGLADEVRVRRVTGMLGRKGYPGGLAHRVVRELLAQEGDATSGAGDLGDIGGEDMDPSGLAEDD